MTKFENLVLTGLGLFILEGAALIYGNKSSDPAIQKIAKENTSLMTSVMVGTGIITASLGNIRNRQKDNALEL